ncbi:ATP-grasp domain-containing protein [Mariniblastus fucicola]|uniref:ATP-grasp domain protein n=1 Tax=Mariniblastus fucicola TaxID=980251 RepID=A0A5B9P7E9_9BACT|nr:ATP-grasp domain-containing protein [Mariniblastus fucicola]QEG22567.1 ATP-grasp domain protein [Mariniblastus fucicola]
MVDHGANAGSPTRVLVVGASGRMAASMLARLGLEPSVADLYGDADTQMICNGRVTRLQRLSDLKECGRLVRAHEFVLFTGGLEGSASLAKLLVQWSRPLFATAVSVERLLDVELLNAALARSGIHRFHFQTSVEKVSWPAVLKDPAHSATARLIAGPELLTEVDLTGQVLQQHIPGESVSLIFVADRGVVSCLGGTLQLTESMKWVGSISGLRLEKANAETAQRFASELVERTGLKGVFGIDFIRNAEGIWPVDINPRIPASAEVVGDHVMVRHLKAFGIECAFERQPTELTRGKMVVFNRSNRPLEFRLGCLGEFRMGALSFEKALGQVWIADVPSVNELIPPDAPVCTVLATGSDVNDLKSKLSRLEGEVLRSLGVENR